MAKLLYSATISLDGYLAGAGGDMHWLNDHLGPNPQVDELVGNIGAILVGRRTLTATTRTGTRSRRGRSRAPGTGRSSC